MRAVTRRASLTEGNHKRPQVPRTEKKWLRTPPSDRKHRFTVQAVAVLQFFKGALPIKKYVMTAICITKRKAHKYDMSGTDLAGELVEPNGLSQNGLSQNGLSQNGYGVSYNISTFRQCCH